MSMAETQYLTQLKVTPELTRAYAGQNCWSGSGTTRRHCAKKGPRGSMCTLPENHGGVTHIAHIYATSVIHASHDLIHDAWMDIDSDLCVDEGL